ncbi:hypothetical protein OG936_36705 [Streptomyces sp. NBC_00846]|uniref:hypothetical protein n=1 Tax=Streptomyces sp. NBC_00846 TaxID=2975849 RepID=UPI0038666D65|nr:hypothetical protein OG936_36705 [Streptomyces sp. NBC_00846]
MRLYPSGCTTTQPVWTGNGPYFVVVDGDLTSTAPVELVTCDYTPGPVIVTGSLNAPSLSFANNIRVFVGGDVRVSACLGELGDRNAVLAVEGELHARAQILDSYADACADGSIRVLIYANGWEQLRPDIVNDGPGDDSRFFRPELLRHDETGTCLSFPAARPGPRPSFPAALRAAFAGEELFLPGVEERFPASLVLRRDSV